MESFKLTSEAPLSILIPPMFRNAFLVKSQSAVYHCKLAYSGEYADAGDQKKVKWDMKKLESSGTRFLIIYLREMHEMVQLTQVHPLLGEIETQNIVSSMDAKC